MEASKRNRRGWDQLMAQAGHKSVVSRNARKRTRAGGRKRSASTKFKSSSRGDSILALLHSAQALEANNPNQSIADIDEDAGDDDWDEDDEAAPLSSRRGGVRGQRPRKTSRGLTRRIARLQTTLLQSSDAFVGFQSALADAAADVSTLIAPALLPPASKLFQLETADEHQEGTTAVSSTPSTPAVAAEHTLLAANGLWRVPAPVKPELVSAMLLDSACPAAHAVLLHTCSMCGAAAWGRYTCPRTGARLCSSSCLTSHNETKLMKFAT